MKSKSYNTKTCNSSIVIKNRVNEIITLQGFEKFRPSPALLDELGGISKHRFTKIVANSLQPSFEESYRLAAWLNVDVSELYKLLVLPTPLVVAK